MKEVGEKRVVITVPAYNEEKSIGKVLDDIKNVMSRTKYDYLIHVLDDGSTDKTDEIAMSKKAFVNHHFRNKGLAETFKSELKACLELQADIIVHTDADGQYMAEDIPALIEKINEGYDLVLGSRFKGKIEHMPFLKRMGNKAFSYVISKLTGVKISDSTTGFRAFTSEVAKEIEFINTFTYTQEQIIKAARLKFRIAEIPIDTKRTRDSRLFKSPLEYAWRAWVNIFRIYRDFDPLRFFGTVGFIFIGLGILAGLAFVVGMFLGYVNLDEHVPSLVLVALSIMTGVQIVLFGFLADGMKK